MANTTGKKFGGRTKGTPNKNNELKTFLIDLVNDSQQKLVDELKKLEGKAFVDSMFALMEYVQPKLSRTEVEAKIEIEEEYIDLTTLSRETKDKLIENHNRKANS